MQRRRYSRTPGKLAKACYGRQGRGPPGEEDVEKEKQGYAEFSTNIAILDIGIRTNLYKLFKSFRTA
ncbi:MAG: hypothetical protein WBI17_09395 [Clostridiaceae bacterium]